jgi:hypothetical protein
MQRLVLNGLPNRISGQIAGSLAQTLLCTCHRADSPGIERSTHGKSHRQMGHRDEHSGMTEQFEQRHAGIPTITQGLQGLREATIGPVVPMVDSATKTGFQGMARFLLSASPIINLSLEPTSV